MYEGAIEQISSLSLFQTINEEDQRFNLAAIISFSLSLIFVAAERIFDLMNQLSIVNIKIHFYPQISLLFGGGFHVDLMMTIDYGRDMASKCQANGS